MSDIEVPFEVPLEDVVDFDDEPRTPEHAEVGPETPEADAVEQLETVELDEDDYR